MGNWTMTIEGHGIHDNQRPDDADAMLAEFVKKLKENGQDIYTVTMHIGSRKALSDDYGWKTT